MGEHGRKQQKNLQQKKARREKKRAKIARETSPNPMIRLAGCGTWPIEHCSISASIEHNGLGQGVLARRMPNGDIAFSMFLIDVYCLGVKNAFWAVKSDGGFETILQDLAMKDPWGTIEPEYLVKVIRGSIAYAADLGFHPHPDYRSASLLLEGIDPTLSRETIEYGKDGKPFYVRGPHESLGRAKEIAARVQEKGGEYVFVSDVRREDWGIADDYEDEDDEFEELPPRW